MCKKNKKKIDGQHKLPRDVLRIAWGYLWNVACSLDSFIERLYNILCKFMLSRIETADRNI